MAAQKGRDLVIKIESAPGSGVFNNVGGLRAKTLDLNDEPVDITDSDSANRWRELMMGAGVRSMSVSGNGLFKDSATENLVRSSQAAALTPNFQIVVPGLGTYSGAYAITGLKFAGNYNGEMNWDFSLASAGEITFA